MKILTVGLHFGNMLRRLLSGRLLCEHSDKWTISLGRWHFCPVQIDPRMYLHVHVHVGGAVCSNKILFENKRKRGEENFKHKQE